MTTEQVLEHYSDLLILQYNSLPKATATVETLCNCNVCDGFFFELQDCFDLLTALGDQLTIIGNIVGVPRNIYGLNLTDTFMSFSNWNGQPASVGYNNWLTEPDADKWASWLTTAIYSPTDFEMLALIQLKIMANTYYTSLGQIDGPLFDVFGNAITLTDNFNKSISYTFHQPYWNVGTICQFLGNICPKPMGCAINFLNI